MDDFNKPYFVNLALMFESLMFENFNILIESNKIKMTISFDICKYKSNAIV